MKTFLKGWAIIFALLLSILKQILEFLRELMRLLDVGRRDRHPQDAYCAENPQTRARPDPFIYSQQWLQLRDLAFTWDNPDLMLIDPATLSAVANHSLKAGYMYHVRATIHNGSVMAAIDTTVHLQVLRFGAGTPTIQDLGTVQLDVPPCGSNVATFDWTTPTTVGKNYTLLMDSYRLPQTPLCPNSTGATDNEGRSQRRRARRTPARNSLAYLRLLQANNDRAKFPVPAYLQARLSHDTIEIRPSEEIEGFVEMNPPPTGQGRQCVNVHVLDGERLLGGITAYVDEE